MMHKIRSILALAFLILSPSVIWGQISPEMIQKARQAGATDAQIQAALSGMNTTNNQSIQQNRTAISDTASGRKELDSAMLAQVNPDVFQHRDSITGRQTMRSYGKMINLFVVRFLWYSARRCSKIKI